MHEVGFEPTNLRGLDLKSSAFDQTPQSVLSFGDFLAPLEVIIMNNNWTFWIAVRSHSHIYLYSCL